MRAHRSESPTQFKPFSTTVAAGVFLESLSRPIRKRSLGPFSLGALTHGRIVGIG